MNLNKSSGVRALMKKISPVATLSGLLPVIAIFLGFTDGSSGYFRYLPIVIVAALVMVLELSYLKGRGIQIILTPVLGLSIAFILWGTAGLLIDLSVLVPLGILTLAGTFLSSLLVAYGPGNGEKKSNLPVLFLTVMSISSVFLISFEKGRSPVTGTPAIIAGLSLLVIFACVKRAYQTEDGFEEEDAARKNPSVVRREEEPEEERDGKKGEELFRCLTQKEVFDLSGIYQQVVNYVIVQQRFTDSRLDMGTVAEALKVSKGSIQRALDLFESMSFSQFINKCRHGFVINMAKADPEHSPTHYWKAAGYSRYRTFLYVFEGKEGMTPTEWKARENGYNGKIGLELILNEPEAG